MIILIHRYKVTHLEIGKSQQNAGGVDISCYFRCLTVVLVNILCSRLDLCIYSPTVKSTGVSELKYKRNKGGLHHISVVMNNEFLPTQTYIRFLMLCRWCVSCYPEPDVCSRSLLTFSSQCSH